MEWADIGERVRECRLAAGLSQEDLAREIGLERTKVAKIEAGDRRIDALELARLSSVLGLPMSHFVHRPPQVLSRRAQLVDDTDSEAARQSYWIEAKLLEWLRDVRQLVELGVLQLGPVLTYQGAVGDVEAAREVARWTRDRLGLGLDPIESLMSVCERAGQLVLVTDLPGDGASLVDADAAVAVVSKKPDPGRRRTTAAHELGHLVLGDEYSSDLGVSASRADRENVIDAFAAELLLPAEVVAMESAAADLRDTLTKLAATYRTSWSLAIRQASQAGIIDVGQVTRWSSVAPTRAELREAVGWAPQPDLDAVRVPPIYAHAVMQAWKDDFITPSRAVELMHGQITIDDLPLKPDGCRTPSLPRRCDGHPHPVRLAALSWDTGTQIRDGEGVGSPMSAALAWHTGPWTIEDIEALPEGDHNRYELLAYGVLTVSAAPEPVHQRASRRLANLLEAAAAQAAVNVEILDAVNIIIPGGRLCVPDIALIDRSVANDNTTQFQPGSVLAVVEIVSPSTTTTDRKVKPDLYAATAVLLYFLLDLEETPATLRVYELHRSGQHVPLSTAPAGTRTTITQPFPIEIDPADLITWP